MSEIFLPKIIKICWSFFKLRSIMSGMFFSRFLFISTRNSLDLLSLGSAEAYSGWGEILNSYLMASCVRNIHTKNYQNLIHGFQVTVKNVGDAFFETQCISKLQTFANALSNASIANPPLYLQTGALIKLTPHSHLLAFGLTPAYCLPSLAIAGLLVLHYGHISKKQQHKTSPTEWCNVQ